MNPALTIRASNFRSFRSLNYSVTPAGLVAIEGMYEGTKDRSNGAGKSTFLPEVLCWAIYGETIGGKTQICSTYPGADQASVEVHLPFVSWTRTQSRDGTGNEIMLEGIRGYREAGARLASFFPPKSIFASTMILGQGVGERFTAWTPGERALALGRLLNLALWQEARKKLSKDRMVLAADLARTQGAVSVYEAQFNELKNAPRGKPENRQAAAKKVAESTAQLSHLNTEHTEMFGQYNNSVATLRQWQTELSNLNREMAQDKREMEQLTGSLTCPTCNRPYLKSQIAGMVAAINARIADRSKRANAIDAEYKTLQASCGKQQGQLRVIEESVAGAQASFNAAQIELAATEDHAARLAEIEKCYTTQRQHAEDLITDVGDLDLLDKGFIEIPIWKIDGVLGILNQRLVEVCNTIWESEFLVQLTSEQALKKGGTKSEIGLVVQNKAGDYSGSSPGQQRKIDITIQLALRELLMSAWPNALPILVCDDVVDVLDPWAKRTFYQNYLLPAAQRSAVFVLTPQAEYPVPMEKRILVQYTEEEGSWVGSSSAAPVVEFHA